MRSYAAVDITDEDLITYGAETWFYTGSVTTLTTKAAIDIHCESYTTGLTAAIFGRVGRACCGVDAAGDLYSEVDEWGIIYGTVEADVDNSTEATLVGACVKDVHISNANGGLDQTSRFQEITGLNASTTYYFKAYGKHGDIGTGYGTTKSFSTNAACTIYYSCAWDADVDNRWSLNSDCSTADGDALVASNLDSICYHRHDWLSSGISDLDADVSTESTTRAMTALPYRLVLQRGSRVVQNNPTYIGGSQIEIQSNAQYCHNGTIDIQIDGTDSDVQGHLARISNAGSLLVDGAYTNAIKMTGTGEFCVYGTFTQTASSPGSVNGDYGSPVTLPDTKYTNGDCVGTSTLPVELIAFDAEKQKNHVMLTWATGSEINNHYFEVLGSEDGKTWEVLGVVQGAGNSVVVNHYSLLDDKVENLDLKYYKLKQVDYDGKTAYSKTKIVHFTTKKGIVKVYDDGQYLHVYYQGLELAPEISLYNTHYQSVKLGGVLIEGKETKHLILKHESLTPGIYFIRLTAKNQVDSYKFLVK